MLFPPKGLYGSLLSNLFSVRAVRLKCRISWWRGSGFVSFSSSSSPSSCSIAFWDVQGDKSWVMPQEKVPDERDIRWHSLISHLSFCLQRRIPQGEASCACIPQGTCLKLCVCEAKIKTKQTGLRASWLVWVRSKVPSKLIQVEKTWIEFSKSHILHSCSAFLLPCQQRCWFHTLECYIVVSS